MSARLARMARNVARARHLPPDARERMEEEILDHLVLSTGEYRERGYAPRKAERLALRDFGDPRKARTDVGRAWQGQRVVLFPNEPGQHLKAFLVYDLKIILLIIAAVILVRWKIVAAYHIPTKSMEPTLHGDPTGGDKILVNMLHYDLFEPERWEVVVFEREGHDQNLIKRIAGLPGETLDIRNGDLYIDGKIAAKPARVQEELLVSVFEDNRDLLGRVEGDERSGLDAWDQTGDWTEEGRRFSCDAGAGGQASLSYARVVSDEYPGGTPRDNGTVVGDLVLSFRVVPGEKTVLVGASLRENADQFEVRIPVGESGTAVLFRNKEEVERANDLRFAPGKERRVELSNIDDQVTVSVDGAVVISYGVTEPSTEPGEGGPAAEFGFQGGESMFRDVTLQRDIHYYRKDSHFALPAAIPPGEYFMLGDNSSTSADSRSWGTVPRSRFIGRPVVVYWPLSRLKAVR